MGYGRRCRAPSLFYAPVSSGAVTGECSLRLLDCRVETCLSKTIREATNMRMTVNPSALRYTPVTNGAYSDTAHEEEEEEEADDTEMLGPEFSAFAARLDESGLLRESLDHLGLKPFLQQVVAPLLDRVGMAWADGSIGIHQEHLVTEVLEDLLRELRLECRTKPEHGCVLLCTLPGERHRLGLLMAALAYAAEGTRTELLGVDLPVASIAQAARALKVDRVAVSLSIQSAGELTRRLLMDLKDRLPSACHLLIGGQGAARTRKVDGVERMTGLEVI